MEQKLEIISESIIKGDQSLVRENVESCLQQGVKPQSILEALIAGMNVVGKRFRNDEVFLPEVMVAARAMHAGLDLLNPLLGSSEIELKGKIALGTVKGDLHDVGKNIVGMMFRGAGFEVIDLGIDIPKEAFVKAIEEHQPDILGLSALLTMTLPAMREAIDYIKHSGSLKNLIIMVGGAPVTEQFAKEVGADGYAPDAASAVDKAKELMEK